MFHKFYVAMACCAVGFLGWAQSQGYDPFVSTGSSQGSSFSSGRTGSSGNYHK